MEPVEIPEIVELICDLAPKYNYPPARELHRIVKRIINPRTIGEDRFRMAYKIAAEKCGFQVNP